MRIKLELSCDGGDSGNNKFKQGWGLAESAFGGSLVPDGQFGFGAFGRNLVSVPVKYVQI
jgi:hypothetical protein